MFGLRSYLEMLLKADIFVQLCFCQAFDVSIGDISR